MELSDWEEGMGILNGWLPGRHEMGGFQEDMSKETVQVFLLAMK